VYPCPHDRAQLVPTAGCHVVALCRARRTVLCRSCRNILHWSIPVNTIPSVRSERTNEAVGCSGRAAAETSSTQDSYDRGRLRRTVHFSPSRCGRVRGPAGKRQRRVCDACMRRPVAMPTVVMARLICGVSRSRRKLRDRRMLLQLLRVAGRTCGFV
jgi:hypothetical protein